MRLSLSRRDTVHLLSKPLGQLCWVRGHTTTGGALRGGEDKHRVANGSGTPVRGFPEL